MYAVIGLGKYIDVYDEDMEAGFETLQHESLDCAISRREEEELMNDLEDRMNSLLRRLAIPLRVVCLPSSDSEEDARIVAEEGLLVIYDRDESGSRSHRFLDRSTGTGCIHKEGRDH